MAYSCLRTVVEGGEGGQLPILIYWNPPLPIFYPIPARTHRRDRARAMTPAVVVRCRVRDESQTVRALGHF